MDEEGHFWIVPGGVAVRFRPEETQLLTDLLRLLAGTGDPAEDPGSARLHPPVYLGDREADAEWRRLAGAELSAARRADRSVFELVIESAASAATPADEDESDEEPAAHIVIPVAEAEAVLRVVNDARLVLGARWGIDGPDDYDRLRPEASAVLNFLGWIVSDLSTLLRRHLQER